MKKISHDVWNAAFETQDKSITLSEVDAEFIVLFFYPKDNTPGCSNEVQDFNLLLDQFSKKDIAIIGISRDSVASHIKFSDKFSLKFPLIADLNEVLCKEFDVIKEKSMFGKLGFGIERSTFVLNKSGEILKEWRKVKVPEHANTVLTEI